MTVLRPITGLSALSTKRKGHVGSVDACRQASAESFWSWVERRIGYHTDAVCESNVSMISSLVSSMNDSDARIRVILTQSATLPDTASPFDRMERTIRQSGTAVVRMTGSSKLAAEQVQTAILMAVLSVDSNFVNSELNRQSVSLKGFDLSVLEELGVRRHVVVMVENADAMDRALLNQVIQTVACLRSEKVSVALVIESDLGEPLIEEVVEDENVFVELYIRKIPLINSDELRKRILSIMLGYSSEIAIVGLPIELPKEDAEFIEHTLAISTRSLSDLSTNMLLSTSNWFKWNSLAVLVGPLISLSEPRLKILKGQIAESKAMTLPKAEALDDLLIVRQAAAIVSKVRDIASRALGVSLKNISNIAAIQPNESGKQALITRIMTELQSQRSKSRLVETIVSTSMKLLESLLEDLDQLGLSPDLASIEALHVLCDRIEPLVGRTYNQTKVMEEWFTHLESFFRAALIVPNFGEETLKLSKLLTVNPMEDLDRLQVDPDPFGPTVDFLRKKLSSKHAHGMIELQEGVKAVFGNTSSQVVDCEILKEKFKKLKGGDFDLAEALATMEFLGLIKPPGGSDFSLLGNAVKIRKNYKDTWLVVNQKSGLENCEADDHSD
jgi:hypothetical protein